MEEIDMNKKKALALVVISASLASSLTACSGKNPVEAVSNLANIAEVQKQPFATTQEIMDYLALRKRILLTILLSKELRLMKS